MSPPLPARWRIVSARAISDGIGGTVWLATLEDGSRAAVKKASRLALPELESALDFLRWVDGEGAIQLLDRQDDLVLLEWAGERTLLDHLVEHGDDAATSIAAEVIGRLHEPSDRPAPASMITLRDNFASLFAKAQGDRRDGRSSQFVRAAERAEVLLSDQRDVRPLHGDIHHENILLSDRGWLAIDPKGLVGDPAFDIANLFYNPVESDLRTSPARAMAMAAILSRELRCNVGKVLDYAYAFSALSASWHLEDGNPGEADRSLAVGQAVEMAARQARS